MALSEGGPTSDAAISIPALALPRLVSAHCTHMYRASPIFDQP